MPVSKVSWEIATRLEKIGEARFGQVKAHEDEALFVEDVKKRIPKIEEAVNELKSYLDKV